MHLSSKTNGNTFFYSSNKQRTNFFSNYNQDNHSKPAQVYHYTTLQDQTIIPALFQQQQQPFSSDHNYHANVFVAHENNRLNTGMKTSKKDRHSKINTARGPRDRRMRLSLDVAKKFFKLQDMLGFDKASNTIQWLLMKSKPAIRDLKLNRSCSIIDFSNSASSPSNCEVLSGIDDHSIEKTGEDRVIIIDKTDFTSCEGNKVKEKLNRGVRKSVYLHHSIAKETREKARARARKRTAEKRNIKLDQYSNRLGSWIPYGENQVQTTTTTDQALLYPITEFQFKQGIVGDNYSVMSSNWSPSILFNYQHNPGPYHEHHLTDFQILGKPWEGLNN